MINIQMHRLVMVKILKDIYSDFQLSSLLGFKGGTALYLFYDLPRFSVDLDFNLLDLSKKDVVYRSMKEIVKKYGKLKDDITKRNTIFFLLSYGGSDRNIKIEISLNEFPNEYEIKQYLGLPVLVMKREYMAAHKLVALTERKGVSVGARKTHGQNWNRCFLFVSFFFCFIYRFDFDIINLCIKA